MIKRKIPAVLLAAVLLAGCAAGTAQGAEQSAQNRSGAAQSAAASEASAKDVSAAKPDLRKLEHGDEDGYYYNLSSSQNSGANFCYADFAAGTSAPLCDIPGCAHDSADCPARYSGAEGSYSDQPYVLDKDSILFFSGVYDAAAQSERITVQTADRSRQNIRTVTDCLFNDLWSSVWHDSYDSLYTDGQTLYITATYQDGAVGLFALDLAEGSTAELLREESCFLFPMGCVGRQLVLEKIPYNAETGQNTEMQFLLYDVDTGVQTAVREYAACAASADGAFTPPFTHSAAVLDGVLYDYCYATGAVAATDLAARETRTVADTMPPDPNEGRGSFIVTLERVLDRYLVARYTSIDRESEGAAPVEPIYLIDLKTGEVREKPALPSQDWNGYSHPPLIYMQLNDRLVVSTRAEPYVYTYIGDDGAPGTINTEYLYFGLISCDDYLTGTPNYTELGMME